MAVVPPIRRGEPFVLPPYDARGEPRDWADAPLKSSDAADLPVAYLSAEEGTPPRVPRAVVIVNNPDRDILGGGTQAQRDRAERLGVRQFHVESPPLGDDSGPYLRELLAGHPVDGDGRAVPPDRWVGGMAYVVYESGPTEYFSADTSPYDHTDFTYRSGGAACTALGQEDPADFGPGEDRTYTIEHPPTGVDLTLLPGRVAADSPAFLAYAARFAKFHAVFYMRNVILERVGTFPPGREYPAFYCTTNSGETEVLNDFSPYEPGSDAARHQAYYDAFVSLLAPFGGLAELRWDAGTVSAEPHYDLDEILDFFEEE